MHTCKHFFQMALLYFLAIIGLISFVYHFIMIPANRSLVVHAEELSFTPDIRCNIAIPYTKPKPIVDIQGYDIDKLAKAVAIHETGDCTAKVGAATHNNCHGFRRNDKFLIFKDKSESYEKFKNLWARDFEDFPTIRLATAYVCGWRHLREKGPVPCPGGNPKSWLASVNSIYYSL